MEETTLLTGAAGFIGSHVAEALLARGHRVVGLDNLNDYYSPRRKRQNWLEVTAGAAKGQAVFVEGDVRDRDMLAWLFQEHSPLHVIHLAGMAGVRVSIEDPHLYCDVNLTGTLNLLEEARRQEVASFVFASTSSVYGTTRTIPFVETDPCDHPLAPYAASKRAAEMLGYTYAHLYGLNFTALRFFTVYGPRNRPDMMAYKVPENILHGTAVPLYNDGQMYRDWTYVTDVAAGVVAAAERPLGYQVINLGRGEPVLLARFVSLIEALVGQKAHLIPQAMPSTDIAYTFADISKARQLLDYEPHVSIDEGVVRFWEWYRHAVLQKV
jgi:UDP-glucuronate 4-epimerase